MKKPRGRSSALLARNAEIVDLYYGSQKRTVAEIADQFGLHHCSVQHILRNNRPADAVGVARPTKGPRPFDHGKPLSKLHRQIGVKLDAHRALDRKINLTEMGAHVRMSRLRLRKAELGLHDFTLSELIGISQLLSIPLASLVTEVDHAHRGA